MSPLIRFRDNDLVEFGGIVWKVRKSSINKNCFTLDEQRVDPKRVFPEGMDPLAEMMASRSDNVTAMNIEGFGEFDSAGRLLIAGGRFTKTPVVSKFIPRTKPYSFWEKLLINLGIK